MIGVGDLVEVATFSGGKCRIILCISRKSRALDPLYLTSHIFQRVTGLESVIRYSAGTVYWSAV